MEVPENKFARYRPWFLSLMLQAPSLHGMSETLGVEEFLIRRAHANAKPVLGLESAREHADIFLGLNDRQSEAMLLIMFIPAQRGGGSAGDALADAWRRGDADTDTRIFMDGFHDFPSLADRLLTNRNRNGFPKSKDICAAVRRTSLLRVRRIWADPTACLLFCASVVIASNNFDSALPPLKRSRCYRIGLSSLSSWRWLLIAGKRAGISRQKTGRTNG